MIKFSLTIINKMQHYIIWASAMFRLCPIFCGGLPKHLHHPKATGLLLLVLPVLPGWLCLLSYEEHGGHQVGSPLAPPLNTGTHILCSHTLPNPCPNRRVFCFLFQNYLLAPSLDLINTISQGPCSIFIFNLSLCSISVTSADEQMNLLKF